MYFILLELKLLRNENRHSGHGLFYLSTYNPTLSMEKLKDFSYFLQRLDPLTGEKGGNNHLSWLVCMKKLIALSPLCPVLENSVLRTRRDISSRPHRKPLRLVFRF